MRIGVIKTCKDFVAKLEDDGVVFYSTDKNAEKEGFQLYGAYVFKTHEYIDCRPYSITQRQKKSIEKFCNEVKKKYDKSYI